MPADLDAGEAGDPELDALLGSISDQELEEARRPLPPMELQCREQPVALNLRGDARQIYEKAAPALGLGVIFDGDFQAGKEVRVRLDAAGCREALRILGAATSTFAVPVSEKLFLVAQDTPQKRQELEHNMAQVIPIPETLTVQEAQELARAVQQVVEIQKLVIDSEQRLVLLRDRVSKVRPAEALFYRLMAARPEVVVEVEFLEVVENSTLAYGFRPPTSVLISFLPDSMPLGFPLTLGLFGITIGDAELVASMSRNSTRTLLRSQVRSVSGQPATLHVGDRYPIQTNAYIGDTSGGGDVFVPPPQINFEDLGVLLKLTPYVHGAGEVTMEIEIEFKILAGAALNGLPVIANRKFQAMTRMRDGEWAVMAGLMRASEARTVTGLAGLSQLPYLGALFRRTSSEKDDRQTLLVIKPTIVRSSGGDRLAPPIWTGTETRAAGVL